MPKSISVALQAELDKTVTSIGYLVQWNMAPIIRWSDLGDITWNSLIWVSADFKITGLRFDPEKDLEATISIQNLDNTIGALFLTTQMADVTVDIYQVSRGALAVVDVVKLGSFAVDKSEIKIDRVIVQLVAMSSLYSFSPRRRIDPYNGFNYAMPSGSVIIWENEIATVEHENG